MRKNKKWIESIYIAFALVFLVPAFVSAQSSSPNYRMEESYFGTGGEVDASSNAYRARQSTGSLGVGQTSSNGFDAVAGDNTNREPYLEAAITGPNVDFGALSPTAASYASSQGGACNCTFYVRTYLSSGYTVISASNPPTSESNNTIPAKGTQGLVTTSDSVAEFGINLVANTVPGTMGAVPVNVPDSTFADGQAATGYQTANQYKYANGDVIARSQTTAGNPAVGQTNYTISYIMKSANLTPAGNYTMRHNLIVVPTF